MLRGTHKEELYNALKISDLSLVISTKKINWKFSKNNSNKISMITSYVKINEYIRKNIANIDLILIMSNANTKNIVEHIRNEKG
jgi:phage tail tube protein FII